MLKYAVAAAVASAALAAPAEAAILRVELTGLFDNGQAISGHIQFDDSLSPAIVPEYYLSSPALSFFRPNGVLSGGGLGTLSLVGGYNPTFNEVMFYSSFTMESGLVIAFQGLNQGIPRNLAETKSASVRIEYGRMISPLQGRLTALTVAPSVPELGTWAMMMLGIAAVSAALRRRLLPAKRLA